MTTSSFYDTQIEWIRELQTLGFSNFFLFLDFFDTPLFYFLICSLAYLLTSPRWGLRFLSVSILSNFTVSLLKTSLQLPRPCHLDPSIALKCAKNYAMPSGGATSSMLIGLLIFYHSKNRIIKTLAILYPLLIGFSRIYIGMHFIHDVVFGYLLGSVLFGVYLYGFPWVEKFLGSISLLATNLFLHLAALFTLLLDPKGLISSYCILLSGFAMGIYLTSACHFFIKPDERFYKKILMSSIGFIGSYAIYQFGPFDLSFRLYTTSIWISFCTNVLFFWIFPKTIKWKNRSIP